MAKTKSKPQAISACIVGAHQSAIKCARKCAPSRCSLLATNLATLQGRLPVTRQSFPVERADLGSRGILMVRRAPCLLLACRLPRLLLMLLRFADHIVRK